jgi:hypothetical protein
MVQSELLLGYGLDDLEFESWKGQDFTKHRVALGPASLLFNGHWGSLPEIKGCGMKLTTHLHLVLRL